MFRIARGRMKKKSALYLAVLLVMTLFLSLSMRTQGQGLGGGGSSPPGQVFKPSSGSALMPDAQAHMHKLEAQMKILQLWRELDLVKRHALLNLNRSLMGRVIKTASHAEDAALSPRPILNLKDPGVPSRLPTYVLAWHEQADLALSSGSYDVAFAYINGIIDEAFELARTSERLERGPKTALAPEKIRRYVAWCIVMLAETVRRGLYQKVSSQATIARSQGEALNEALTNLVAAYNQLANLNIPQARSTILRVWLRTATWPPS